MITKIISGGQTGVDRAALDAAISLNLPIGGWCPKGRIDENGLIPEIYSQLQEITETVSTEKENYDARTRLNIRDSDGTLILLPEIPVPQLGRDGTILTIEEVSLQKKPYLLIDLNVSLENNTKDCVTWIKTSGIHILNIAGPRESSCGSV